MITGTRTRLEATLEEVRIICNPTLERNFDDSRGGLNWKSADQAVRDACAHRPFRPWMLEYELFRSLVIENAEPIYKRLREELTQTGIEADDFTYRENQICGISQRVLAFALEFRYSCTIEQLRVLEVHRPHAYRWNQVLLAMRDQGERQHFATATIITMIALALEEMD